MTLDSLPISPESTHVVEVAVQAGLEAIKEKNNYQARCGSMEGFLYTKQDNSVTSAGDLAAEFYLYKKLHEHDPYGKFVGEESLVNESWVATTNNFVVADFHGLFANPTVYVIDPVDNTRDYAAPVRHTDGIKRQQHRWAVSVGTISHGIPMSGVVVVPEENIICVAETDKGTFLQLRQSGPYVKQSIREWDGISVPETAYGAELETDLRFQAFLCRLKKVTNARRIISSAEGLRAVACGEIHGYYHGFVYGHDHAAGRVLVTESGGEAKFGKLADGRLHYQEGLDEQMYDPAHPSVSVAAGHPSLINREIPYLERTFGKASCQTLAASR